MRLYLLVLFIFVCIGCASKVVILKNNESGDTKICQSTAIAGSWQSIRNINACVKALEKAGYKKVEI